MATICGLKNTAAGRHKSGFLANKVDVVDPVINPERSLSPVGAAVLGIAEESTVAAHPATFRVGEINSIQIFTTGTNSCGSPAALRVTNHRGQPEHDREHQRHSLFWFPFHRPT